MSSFSQSFLFKLFFEKPAFSNSSKLKRVFEKLCFHDGLVWTEDLTVEIKLHFTNFSAVVWTGLNSVQESCNVNLS